MGGITETLSRPKMLLRPKSNLIVMGQGRFCHSNRAKGEGRVSRRSLSAWRRRLRPLLLRRPAAHYLTRLNTTDSERPYWSFRLSPSSS
jgi:hypothetical protein